MKPPITPTLPRTLVALALFALALSGGCAGSPSGPPAPRQPAAIERTPSASLAELDRIVAEAPNLPALLESPDILDRYFNALRAYFPAAIGTLHEQFTREKFDLILDQLRLTLRKVPGLAERLWETEGTGEAFAVENRENVSTLVLNRDAWLQALSAWTRRLKEQRSEEDPARVLDNYARWIAEFERALAVRNPPKRRAAIERSLFLHAIKREPALRGVAARLLHDALTAPASRTMGKLYGLTDADLVLDQLEELRSSPGMLLEELSRALPKLEVLPSLLSELMLDPKELRRQPGFFAENAAGSAPKGVYRFVPVPRRLHGIWKTPLQYDCLAGSCTRSLTPERWSSVALARSQLHFIEFKGRYAGFTQIVPVRLGSAIYGGYEPGAHVLGHDIVIGTGRDRRRLLLFEAALEEQLKHLPPDWTGLVLGEKGNLGSTQARRAAYGSAAYLLGPVVGQAEDARHLDPLVRSLTRAIPRMKWAKAHGGNMVTEATVSGAGSLIRLVPTDRARLEEKLKDPSWIRATMDPAAPMRKRATLLTHFGERGAPSPALWDALLEPITTWSDAEKEQFGFRMWQRGFEGTVENLLPEEALLRLHHLMKAARRAPPLRARPAPRR
jgi:hypothetical protein